MLIFYDPDRDQGDLLSPLLFVLVMEALSRLMDRAMEGGYLDGFSVVDSASEILKVSHLLFSNDTLIFCGPDCDQLLHLKGVLLCFEAMLGCGLIWGNHN